MWNNAAKVLRVGAIISNPRHKANKSSITTSFCAGVQSRKNHVQDLTAHGKKQQKKRGRAFGRVTSMNRPTNTAAQRFLSQERSSPGYGREHSDRCTPPGRDKHLFSGCYPAFP